MSDLLTWRQAGPAPKTGTTNTAMFDDIATLINNEAANDDFLWEVASVNSAATPFYCVLKRKDASVGRILVVLWSSAPAGNNAAICISGAPSNNSIYMTWFPNGNTDTPLNLTAASGTILGDDTDVLFLTHRLQTTTAYSGTKQIQCVANEEGLVFSFQADNDNDQGLMGAGNLVVDYADNAYPACFGHTAITISANWPLSIPYSFSTDITSANWPLVRSHHPTPNSNSFIPFSPAGLWNIQLWNDTNDVLHNHAESKMWLLPTPLAPYVKGGPWDLKMRQMAIGPTHLLGGDTFNSYIYDSNALQPDAIQLNLSNKTVDDSFCWFTNYKI